MSKHIVDNISAQIEAGDEVSQEDVYELLQWAVKARDVILKARDVMRCSA